MTKMTNSNNNRDKGSSWILPGRYDQQNNEQEDADGEQEVQKSGIGLLVSWLNKQAPRPGLVQRTVKVHRRGKVIEQRRWVRPTEALKQGVQNLQHEQAQIKRRKALLEGALLKLRLVRSEFPSADVRTMIEKIKGQIKDLEDREKKEKQRAYGEAYRARQREAKRIAALQANPPKGALEFDEHEKKMMAAPVQEYEALRGGCNESVIVHFEDGTQGIYKPAEGETENLRRTIPTGTFYKREVAAYKMCKLLDMDYCPPTVIRDDMRSGIGSIQRMVGYGTEDYRGAAHHVIQEAWDQGTPETRRKIEDLAFYNIIMGNSDRHGGNALMSRGREVKEGPDEPVKYDVDFVAIDHGCCFPTQDNEYFCSTFVQVCAGKRLPDRLQHKINNLLEDKDKVKATLAPYLETSAIELIFQRAQDLKEAKVFGEPKAKPRAFI